MSTAPVFGRRESETSSKFDSHDLISAMETVTAIVRDGVRMFDLAVINEIWGIDRTSDGVPAFQLRICTADGKPVTTDMGSPYQPSHEPMELTKADLLIVPGNSTPEAPANLRLLDLLRNAEEAGTPIAALCSGAFLLGQAGLLDGRRVTTHWLHAAELQAQFPKALVEQDSLFLEDRSVWTSAGTVAGIDLCLHLLQSAHGARATAAVARRMITQPYRSGGQRQFIEAPIPPRISEEERLGQVISWATENLDQPLTVTGLAKRAQMSERTFARRFLEATGSTPLRWLHHQRCQLAQRLLETDTHSIEEVATSCGFGSPAVLRRHFMRFAGTTPSEYRRGYLRAVLATS